MVGREEVSKEKVIKNIKSNVEVCRRDKQMVVDSYNNT